MVESLDDALNILIIEVARPLAIKLGETEKAIEWGLRLSVVALVEALRQRGTDSEFFDKVLKLIDAYRRTNASAAAETFSAPASTAVGNSLVDGLLGADRRHIMQEIAHAAQLPSRIAASVLSVAAILLLRSLEPEASHQKLDATASRERLSEEALDYFLRPPSATGESIAAESMNATAPAWGKARSSLVPWLLFAVATIGTLGLTWRLGSDAHPSHESTVAAVKEAPPSAMDGAAVNLPQEAPPSQVQKEPPASQKQVAPTGLNELRTESLENVFPTPTQGTPSPPAEEQELQGFKEAETIMKPAEKSGDTHRDIIRKKLPNGVELRILESGVENQLLAFLEQASPDSGEFNLDRISFDRAKSTLQSSLQEQLQNLAKILKAYPNTRIAINSYTDDRGNKARNLKLSRERANNVLRELVRMGVDKSRMTAQGLGDNHSIASNNSEEGRRQNRRISLSVTRD